MLRIVFLYVIPFLIPFVLYVLWIKHSKRKNIPNQKIILLALIALALLLSGLALWDRTSSDSLYEAPKFKDGVIIPAHITPVK